MKRLPLLLAIALLPLLPLVAKQELGPPNFVVILCDDLGYGDLACYGHPHIKTPHLDKLAKEGNRLTDCYASAPVCSSSRAGLLTGLTPNRTGVYDWIPPGHTVHLRKFETTLSSLLRDAGYDTAHSGKWHLNGKFNSPLQPQPGDHGFNHWFGTQNNAAPSHENPTNFVRNGKPVGKLEGFSCRLVADEGVRWLQSGRDKKKPFYLNIWFHEPHEPVASPPKKVEGYKGKAKNVDQAQYFANVENLDAAVGKLLKALDKQGLADNTVVLFTSDNGPETLRRYGERAKRSYGTPGPLRGMKLHIYDGGIRVPGILRWPGLTQPGKTIAEPISAVDLLPTFCKAANVKLPNARKLDGADFRPALAGQPIERTTPLFWHYYRALSQPKVALRDGDWKLVAHWNGPARPIGGNVNPGSMRLIKTAKLTKFELYNIREDIAESKNLADTHKDKAEALAERLRKKYLQVQAEGPDWGLVD